MGQSQVEATSGGCEALLDNWRPGPEASAGKAVEIPATKPAATSTRLARIPTQEGLA